MMTPVYRSLSFLSLFLFSFLALPLASQPSLPTEEEKSLAIANLNWLAEDEEYLLPQSNSTFFLPAGFSALIGEEAQKLSALTEGQPKPELEAAIFDDLAKHTLLFEYHADRFPSLDKWRSESADHWLELIQNETEKQNGQRRLLGEEELYVVGWQTAPQFDEKQQSFSFVTQLRVGKELEEINDNQYIVNAVTIKLGRYGYERINWICAKEDFLASQEHLQPFIDSHQFNLGYRLQDRNFWDTLKDAATMFFLIGSCKEWKSGP